MPTVNIRTLRGELAHWVQRAGRGEQVVVSVGGRPVARLGGLDATGPTLEALTAGGLLRPPRRDDRPPPSVAIPTWAGVRMDTLLTEVRGR